MQLIQFMIKGNWYRRLTSYIHVASVARNALAATMSDLLQPLRLSVLIPNAMSSPKKPRLSVITSFNSNRDSITTRNVSSPFSLAIPGRNSKRSSRPFSIPLSIRPTSSVYSQDQDGLEVKDKITPLKPAVIVPERPIRPHPENRQSRALAAYQRRIYRNPFSKEKRKFHVTCWNIDDRVLALSVTLTLAFLIVIGVPLVAVMAQKFVVQLPVSVLVPSYAFPDASSWNRLYDAYVLNDYDG
jgi:hypothetical protein